MTMPNISQNVFANFQTDQQFKRNGTYNYFRSIGGTEAS